MRMDNDFLIFRKVAGEKITELMNRAERAEAAETVALAKWNGALERAMKAEADLAKARATAELRDSLAIGQDNCDDAYDELATDCAELRADVVRITARAEKAEADLAAAKERLRSEAMDDYASIKDLQRELATERARLDSGQILLTVAGERVWHCGVDLRAAIDAAMKEGGA